MTWLAENGMSVLLLFIDIYFLWSCYTYLNLIALKL